MSLTGLIFGAIAAAWLLYLVPYSLRRREVPDDVLDAELAPSQAVTIVHTGDDLSSADDGTDIVSTPASRQAQLRELRDIDRRAARRRVRVLLVLAATLVAAVVLSVLGIGEWWDAFIPVGLIVVFLVVSRVTVRALRADLARRAQRITASATEETVAIRLTPQDVAEHEHSIELSVPIGGVGSLWEPIPIARPTYVSTPIAPRTVRTIDLTPPAPSPVLAEILEQLDVEERLREWRRDVG